MASKKTHRSTADQWVDMDAFAEVTKAVEKVFGKDTKQVYDEAFDVAMKVPNAVLADWFGRQHRRTGATTKAYIPGKTLADWDKNIEGYQYYRVYGYDRKKTVVPSFFEYGSPRKAPYRIEPEFVIYYSFRDFKDTIHKDLRRVIVQKLKDYGATVRKEVEFE